MKWESKLIKHQGTVRIAVLFENKADLIARIKSIAGSRWSQSLGVWHLPDTEENRLRFQLPLHSTTTPSEEGILQIEKFKQWLLSKRYSPSTIKTYSEAMKSFLTFFREKPIGAISNEDVIVYNNEYILKKQSVFFLPKSNC